MPAQLPEPTTRVSWRINTKDLLWLETTYGTGQVNRVVRDWIEQLCQRQRERQRLGAA